MWLILSRPFLDWIIQSLLLPIRPKKNMCVYCHMLKKIRVGRSEIIFYYFLFFYNWIGVG